MKTFKELMEAPGAPAQDNKVDKDDEKEVKGYKPRSKGEEDFAKAHTMGPVSGCEHRRALSKSVSH